jgi:hypothetical protein
MEHQRIQYAEGSDSSIRDAVYHRDNQIDLVPSQRHAGLSSSTDHQITAQEGPQAIESIKSTTCSLSGKLKDP